MIGGTIHDTLLAEFGFDAIPNTGWDLILLALVCFILYLGVGALHPVPSSPSRCSRSSWCCVFCAYVVIKVGGDNSVSTAFSPSSSPDGWSGVLFGVLYGVLLFTGFETAANLGEETAHPKRDIPRAVITAVIVIGAFYLFVLLRADRRLPLQHRRTSARTPWRRCSGSQRRPRPAATAASRSRACSSSWSSSTCSPCSSASRSPAPAVSSRCRATTASRRGLGKVSKRGTPLRASVVVVVIFALFIVATRQFIHLFAAARDARTTSRCSRGSRRSAASPSWSSTS